MSVLVSKIDLGILALGGLAVFLIVRGGGKFLEGLGNPLSGLGDSLPSIPDLPNIQIPNPFQGSVTVTEATPNPVTGQPLNPSIADVPLEASQVPTVVQQPSLIDNIISTLTGQSPNNVPIETIQAVETPNQLIPVGAGSVQELLDMIAARDNQLTPAQQFAQDERGQVPVSVPSPFDDQQFQGGGPSFIGGQINEIPLANLSLSDIVDRFNVTASQAANLQAEFRNNFGDFDFGGNTGSGLGSVFSNPDINPLISGGNVSNSEFSGLSPAEIAQRLTGGNISNF